MSDTRDILKDPIQIIKEIENQLEENTNKKIEEIEKELEEGIKREQKEAKEKIDQIQKEFEDKKEALTNYRTRIAKFEDNITNIKEQEKKHLDKAIQFLKEIKNLSVQILEELKKATELVKRLEKLDQATKGKIAVFKKDFEEKFTITNEGLEIKDDEEIALEQERLKLEKIMELLQINEINEQ